MSDAIISKKANAIYRTASWIRFKEKMNFEHPRRAKYPYIYLILGKNNAIQESEVQGRKIYTISPQNRQGNEHILYFHGGGYAAESSINHFILINKLIKRCQHAVTFVEYPVTPESHCEQTLEMVLSTYDLLMSRHPEDRWILMGDSAGGGLALVLAMLIRDAILLGSPWIQPEGVVLLSPWLDVSMSNEEIQSYDEKDVFLNLEVLKEAGRRYAGSLSLDDFRVSPIYGDLTNLGKVFVLYGSDEVLRPDCHKLCNEINAVGSEFVGIEYLQMQHDWIVFPIPEQERALDQICDFIKKQQNSDENSSKLT